MEKSLLSKSKDLVASLAQKVRSNKEKSKPSKTKTGVKEDYFEAPYPFDPLDPRVMTGFRPKEKTAGQTPLEKKNKTPEENAEEEVNNFIRKFDLSTILPREFADLNTAQQLKVTKDLQRRIVDIVKSDAQTQYSEELKKKVVGNLGKKALASIKSSLSKETDIKNIEAEIFADLRDTDQGRQLILDNLQTLTEITKDQDIDVDRDGNLRTYYVNVYKEIKNPSQEEMQIYFRFGDSIKKYASIPYEWGQETASRGIKIKDKKIGYSHKKEYDEAKAEYEKARTELLRVKTAREEKEGLPDEKGKAMLQILEIDNAIQLEQLLNTHPEVEKTIADFEKTAGGKEMLKNAGNFLQTITGGKNLTNKLLFLGGFGARMGVKAISAASSATGVGAIGSITVGGVIGGLRGRMRAKETLTDRKKQARHGQKDESEEATNTASAENLNNRLESMIEAFENTFYAEDRAKLLDQIKRRIAYTQDKIESGLVNFGDAKSALNNQFDLVNNLNRALVISASSEEETRRDIDQRLERFLSYREDKISEAQNAYIKKQMVKGAAMGAGFATLGYTLRWIGENIGYWEHHGAQVLHQESGSLDKSSEGFMKRVEDWMGQKKEYYESMRHPQKLELQNPKAPGLPQDYATNPAFHSHDAIGSTDSIDTTNGITPGISNFHEVNVTIDHGHGAIRGIADLQKSLHEQYPDPSKAPQSVQDFLNAKPTTEAIRLGLYDPSATNESALIHTGSTLSFDEHGTLTLHDSVSGDHALIEGDADKIDQYDGAMLHTHHEAVQHLNHDNVDQQRPPDYREGLQPSKIQEIKAQLDAQYAAEHTQTAAVDETHTTIHKGDIIDTPNGKIEVTGVSGHVGPNGRPAGYNYVWNSYGNGGNGVEQNLQIHGLYISPEQGEILNHNPGLAEFINHTPTHGLDFHQLQEAYTARNTDMGHVFGSGKENILRSLSTQHAKDVLKVAESAKPGDTSTPTIFSSYMHTLRNVTKIEPKSGLFSKETAGAYIDRMYASALKNGQLSTIKHDIDMSTN